MRYSAGVHEVAFVLVVPMMERLNRHAEWTPQLSNEVLVCIRVFVSLYAHREESNFQRGSWSVGPSRRFLSLLSFQNGLSVPFLVVNFKFPIYRQKICF